jgi:hypothetical protein
MGIKIQKLIAVLAFTIWTIFFIPLAYAGNPPDAAHSSLTGTEVAADGTTQSTIKVTLQDATGTPLAGDTVSLANNTDSSLKISPSSGTLDASGSATFTATSQTPGVDAISVTDSTTGTTLDSLGQVTFDPSATPASPQCTATAPTSAPNLYQVVMVNSSATLYITPPSGSYDGFTISYGTDANANSYSTSFSQGATSGAVQHTVNSLTPNTKYYFMVRATNGCAAGPWSTVVSTSGSSSTPPTTGPTDIIYIGIAALFLALGGIGIFVKNK